MNLIDRYIISENTTIKESLVALNEVISETQTLLVVDTYKRLVGTLTDGDIRRGLISGASLFETVNVIMHTDFKYMIESNYDVNDLKEFRNQHIFFIPILDKEYHVVDVVNLKKIKSLLPIDAVLMAGGKGERLRPLTEKIPKPLLSLGGKPIIDYIVEHIISFGISNINVTTNYLHEQIEEHFLHPKQDIIVKTVLEPKFLGTIGSIRYVKEFKNDTILLMNSDAITDLDIEDFYLHFKEHNASMSIAAIPYNISIPYGIFELNGRNVTGVREKPIYNYYANSGIYLIKKETLNLIPKETFFNATDFMELLISKGFKVIRYPFNGMWLDIGQHSELEKAKEFVKHMK